MKIVAIFSLGIAIVLGAVLLTGNSARAQVAATSQGNIYPNAVVVVPVAAVQPNQINNINNNNNIRPFFPNFFNPFFHPFFNNNFFDPFSGVGSSPLLIP